MQEVAQSMTRKISAVAILASFICIATHHYIPLITCNSCNMGTRDLPDIYAQSPRAAGRGLRAYISGKSRVHMLQLICNTSICMH